MEPRWSQDGAKQVKGRKRFALVDTQGNVLDVVVLPANTGERQGAREIFENVHRQRWSQTLQLAWADGMGRWHGPMQALPVPSLNWTCRKSLAGGSRLCPSRQSTKALPFFQDGGWWSKPLAAGAAIDASAMIMNRIRNAAEPLCK